MSDTTATATPAAIPGLALSGAMPLYADPRPVAAITHRDHAILPDIEGKPDDFSFAAKMALVPVTVDEFGEAALHYPIVFVGPERRAFVVTGLTADRNLFVNDDGTYAVGIYIPAYLRRYPFVFARDTDDRLRILCLDEASARVGSTADADARPLFDGDTPTELTQHAIAFCQEMDAAETRTTILTTLIADLFVAQQAHSYTDDIATLLLDYLAVDAGLLDALGDEAFAEVRRAGALPAIYAHILSAGNWNALQARLAGQ